MKIGYIGLGKMGLGMVKKMLEKGHEVVAYNRSPESVKLAEEAGAKGAYTLSEVVSNLESPRTIWLMVPWQSVDSVLKDLLPLLSVGDLIIDGGNSPYVETIRRANELQEKEINFIDIGVSGGPAGARNGACMMIGGDEKDVKNIEPLIKDCCIQNGYAHVGPIGAGHYVKMVHNGIEYGMMQAIAEGFALMKQAPEFKLNLKAITDVYNHGSVIESRLVGWLGKAYSEFGEELEGISGEVSHSGEGLWTVEAAKRSNLPVEIIEKSLKFREDSVGNPSYAGQVVSALRNQFGGHDVSKK